MGSCPGSVKARSPKLGSHPPLLAFLPRSLGWLPTLGPEESLGFRDWGQKSEGRPRKSRRLSFRSLELALGGGAGTGTDRRKKTSGQMENHVPSVKPQVRDWSVQREFLRSAPSLERMSLPLSLTCPRLV